MKKVWLIGMALPLLLVTGCSADVTNVRNEYVSTSIVKSVSKEEYVKLIFEYQESLTSELNALITISNAYDETDYVKKYIEQIDKVKSIVAKYKLLNPPTEFRNVQASYLLSSEYFDKGLDSLSNFFNPDANRSQDILDKAKSDLKKGRNYFILAFEEFLRTIELEKTNTE